MRLLKQIIVHCADTPSSMDIGVEEIRKWHTEERGWSDIGYHYVIRRDGKLEEGRPLDRYGAHCSGQNRDSIGICLVGRDAFNTEQYESLRGIIRGLVERFGPLTVHGHCEYSDKTCPNFDVSNWLEVWMG